MKEHLNSKYKHRPILLIANSSWYLWHYRKLLIESLKKNKEHVIAISPIDLNTKYISKKILHVPFKMFRSSDLNPFSLIISLLKMYFTIRLLKPKLIHSHTLKSNLITSIISSFFGIPCVLSFAGMGRSSEGSFLKILLLKFILKFTYFFACRERISRFKWQISKSNKRTFFIFQNLIDQQFFQENISKNFKNFYLIMGSGIPNIYLNNNTKSETSFSNEWQNPSIKNVNESLNCQFIFCSRLIKSKGLNIFIDLAKCLSNHQFFIMGGFDNDKNSPSAEQEFLFEISKIKNITFRGNVKNPLLDKSFKFPILVLPSIYGEGLSRSLCEAASQYIPIISSIKALSGIFNSELTYSTELHKVESYMECFDSLIVDYHKGKIKEKLRLNYEFVRNNLTEEIIVEQTKKVYEALLNQSNSDLLNKQLINKLSWISK